MNLHLMRHGIAEPLGERNQFQDFRRALTSEGQQKMLEVSKGLKKLQVNFQLVASSPLLRARETAEVVVEVLKIREPVQLWDELGAGFSVPPLLKKLESWASLDSVLLVGHQPDLGSLASYLVFGDSLVSLDLRKGGICCIQVAEFPPQLSAQLVWMLPPRLLRLMAGTKGGDSMPDQLS
jgi:phosphohistidine phosphatase